MIYTVEQSRANLLFESLQKCAGLPECLLLSESDTLIDIFSCFSLRGPGDTCTLIGNSNENLSFNNYSLFQVITAFHRKSFGTKKTFLKTHLDNEVQGNVQTFITKIDVGNKREKNSEPPLKPRNLTKILWKSPI